MTVRIAGFPAESFSRKCGVRFSISGRGIFSREEKIRGLIRSKKESAFS